MDVQVSHCIRTKVQKKSDIQPVQRRYQRYHQNRHFWAEGYYVSTVGLNEATIKKYIQEQEKHDIALDKLSVKVLVIVHFMDSFKVRFAHAKHSKVSEYNITILNLMLRPVGCHIHAVEFFDEIAFSKEGTHNSQTAGWDNAFICKLNNNVLIGVQRDPVIIIHGKRLQSIGFVTSILPYIFSLGG